MSIVKKISVISNLTSGGGVVYKTNLLNNMKGCAFEEYTPAQFIPTKNKATTLLKYIKYIYFDLFFEYYKISKKINSNRSTNKVIVFQDSYIKAPYAFIFLNKKTIYILHEPPREFYEPIKLHAPKTSSVIFNFTIRLLIKYFDRLLTKKASIIISNSNYSKENIKKIYSRDSICIYPGMNFPKNKKTIQKNTPVFCISVGSLLGYKGHEKTINSIATIKKDRPKLMIVGDGPDFLKRKLLNLSNEVGVDVEIKKNVDDQTLCKMYENSNVYINSAFCEPFGLSSLEAINYGCILVTNNTGGTSELKKFYPNSVLVSNDTFVEMGDSIKKALKRKRLIPEKNIAFDWHAIGKKIASLL